MTDQCFTVYGLIDPRNNRVFYVGQTFDLKQRMLVHYAGDANNPSFDMTRALKARGMRVGYCVFGVFQTREDALRLERALILTLPSLVNSKKRQSMLSQRVCPMTDRDDAMLDAALNPMPEAKPYATIFTELPQRRALLRR